MASPIQNMIGITAAGAAPAALANNLARANNIASQINPVLQQVVATQATEGSTKPGVKRITDGEDKVGASFDSEGKNSKPEDGDDEGSQVATRPHNGRLNTVA